LNDTDIVQSDGLPLQGSDSSHVSESSPAPAFPESQPVAVDSNPVNIPGEPSDSGPVADSMPEPAPAEAVPEAAAETVMPVFSELGLSEPIQRAIAEMGYVHPTPIQAQAIPVVLAGRDVMGVAQTGTGKTASFTLPLLDILSGSRARARMPRSLILEPTRELALQVAENFLLYGKYLKLNHALLIGGESMSEQKDALNRGVDVLIATPGRLLDLFERGGLLLTQTSILVIDEADRMLDMGFIPDVERIVSLLSPKRQTLFFSATMAPEIRRLSEMFLQNPKEITVSRAASVATTIEEGLAVVPEADKRRALRRLLRTEDVQNALIFCNRKRDVDILHKSLKKHGFSAGALHGDLPQPVRFATLEKFKAGELQLLVCSDVAARGIDIGGLSHVFNFDVPIHAEDYVHRIGRTGRAGRTGHALGLASPYDRMFVEAIEKLIGHVIPRIAVEGIDSVEWAEDARGGRGRGRGRVGKPERDRGDKPARIETNVETTATVPAEPAAAAPRRDRKRPEQAVDRAPQDRGPDRGPDRGADRTHRRDERRPRSEEPGSVVVVGFGDDVPAFMLLPTRASRPTVIHDDPPFDEDTDDLPVED
jgi:superfamily II DNA/RNA helicase